MSARELMETDASPTPHTTTHTTLDARFETARELATWLRALKVFFLVRFHPTADPTGGEAWTRSWKVETRIAHQSFLHCAHLALQLTSQLTAQLDNNAANDSDNDALASIGNAAEIGTNEIAFADDALAALAANLDDAANVAEALTIAPQVPCKAWVGLGRLCVEAIERNHAAKQLGDFAMNQSFKRVDARLREIANHIEPSELSTDVLFIFARLASLLDYLKFIEPLLQKDYALKQTLPLWVLIHEETNALLDFINSRALQIENLNAEIFDALDGTSYAIGMELRKVFAHELLAINSSRQAAIVFMKVENAHGLLRDCFQQSIVTLAQAFDAEFDSSQLFAQIQTKLDQSLALRRDVWRLMKRVRDTERSRDMNRFATLLEACAVFRKGSLRYLMYKDWEAYERFVEEATAARGAAELIPVLHRFGTFLETLFGQINMRAALAAHPFEDTEDENDILQI